MRQGRSNNRVLPLAGRSKVSSMTRGYLTESKMYISLSAKPVPWVEPKNDQPVRSKIGPQHPGQPSLGYHGVPRGLWRPSSNSRAGSRCRVGPSTVASVPVCVRELKGIPESPTQRLGVHVRHLCPVKPQCSVFILTLTSRLEQSVHTGESCRLCFPQGRLRCKVWR